jgi:ferredoxin
VAVVIDERLCELCGTCVKKCPWKAITMKKKIVVNPDECVECGTCVESCPNTAILFE